MDGDARVQTAEELIRRGEFDDAIALLTNALADNPENHSALLAVGIAYTESGRNEEAIRTLGYYTARNDANDEAWEALGCAYLRRKEFVRAEECLRRAREIAPTNASVLRNLSVLLSQTERPAESLKALRTSYDLNPNDYLTTFALATAYRFLGRGNDARALFERLRSFEFLPDAVRSEAEKHLLALSVGWS